MGSSRLSISALTLALLSALLVTRPAQAQTETVLYNFTDGSGGGFPLSSLTPDGAGNFYGTADSGGSGGHGVVFELSSNGHGGWKQSVLFSFNGKNGSYPTYSSVLYRSGKLYGTAYSGGAHGYGVVFEVSFNGKHWEHTVVYNFTGGTQGGYPNASLIMDSDGNLYGSTEGDGNGTDGIVFELSPAGTGWSERLIYDAGTTTGFTGLTIDSAGTIFGVNQNAQNGLSYVVELTPTGHDSWMPTVIHTFTGYPKDGTGAAGSVVLDNAGNLYGVTSIGGPKGQGMVYKLIPEKNGEWTEKILYSFKGFASGKDGANPEAGIVFDPTGNIYGTTSFGGDHNDGTVFELVAPVGTGSYKEKVLWNFDNTDGAGPNSGLTLDAIGNLYGMTAFGGSSTSCGSYCGVVFEVVP
jgi:uncharacterized repeat protein (TIGR03803 family)